MLAARVKTEATVADLIGMPWDDYIDAFLAAYARDRDDEAQRGIRAMRLAPTLSIYRALMKGQKVPVRQLDPFWRRQYVRKPHG